MPDSIPEIQDALTALESRAKGVRDTAITKLGEIKAAYTKRNDAGPNAEERAKVKEITDARDAAIAAIALEREELRTQLETLKNPVDEGDAENRADNTDDADAARETRDEVEGVTKRSGNKPQGTGARYEFRSSVRSYAIPVAQQHRTVSADAQRAAFWSHVLGRSVDGMTADEVRSVQFDIDTEGGFLAPAPVVADVIKQIDDLLLIRQYATVVQSPLSGLGHPTIETKLSQGNWGGEIKPLTANNTLKFGKRELKPNIYRDLVLVSNVSLAAGMAESLVTGELSRAAGEAQEQAFMTGTGAGQPLGMFVANAAGIPAARDVNTGSATAFTVEGLVDLKGSVKRPYRDRAHWIMHRDALTQVERLKDADGLPIWQRSLSSDRPDTLLGAPVLETEFAPNTFTNGNYGAVYGDLSKYVIADAMAISVSRNPFEYQKQNQTAFYVGFHVDAMPASVGGEAFARQKFST